MCSLPRDARVSEGPAGGGVRQGDLLLWERDLSSGWFGFVHSGKKNDRGFDSFCPQTARGVGEWLCEPRGCSEVQSGCWRPAGGCSQAPQAPSRGGLQEILNIFPLSASLPSSFNIVLLFLLAQKRSL